MSEKVLDSSAVLAYLHKETGWEHIESSLRNDECVICTVNHAEVVSKLAEKGLPEAAIRSTLDALNLQSVNFDSILSVTAGLLRPPTKSAGLSLGDRACLALARHRNVPALTTDKAWQNLAIGIAVTVIR
jgi:PIN domain nuclease of toxin-antitoxin system